MDYSIQRKYTEWYQYIILKNLLTSGYAYELEEQQTVIYVTNYAHLYCYINLLNDYVWISRLQIDFFLVSVDKYR